MGVSFGLQRHTHDTLTTLVEYLQVDRAHWSAVFPFFDRNSEQLPGKKQGKLFYGLFAVVDVHFICDKENVLYCAGKTVPNSRGAGSQLIPAAVSRQ